MISKAEWSAKPNSLVVLCCRIVSAAIKQRRHVRQNIKRKRHVKRSNKAKVACKAQH